MVLHHGCLYYFQRTDSGSTKGQFALNGCRCSILLYMNQETISTYLLLIYFIQLHYISFFGAFLADTSSPIVLHCRCEKAPERSNDDRYPYVFKVIPDNEKERTYYFSSPSKAEMEVRLMSHVNSFFEAMAFL